MYFKIFNIRKIRADMKNKNGHNSAPEHPQGSEFDTRVPTMSPEALAHPTGQNFN